MSFDACSSNRCNLDKWSIHKWNSSNFMFFFSCWTSYQQSRCNMIDWQTTMGLYMSHYSNSYCPVFKENFVKLAAAWKYYQSEKFCNLSIIWTFTSFWLKDGQRKYFITKNIILWYWTPKLYRHGKAFCIISEVLSWKTIGMYCSSTRMKVFLQGNTSWT